MVGPYLSPIPSCPTIHFRCSLIRPVLNQRAPNQSFRQRKTQGTLLTHKLSHVDRSPLIVAILRRWLPNNRSRSLCQWSQLLRCPSPPTPGARPSRSHTHNPTTLQGLCPCTPSNRSKQGIRRLVTRMAHTPPPNHISRVRSGGHMSLFKTGHRIPAPTITTIPLAIATIVRHRHERALLLSPSTSHLQ
jgi:hypothetical protein